MILQLGTMPDWESRLWYIGAEPLFFLIFQFH